MRDKNSIAPAPSNPPTSSRLCLVLNLLALGILFVALRWNNCATPLVRDEGEYAYAAQLLKQGIAPYDHSFLQKPPMVIYSYMLAQALMPGVFWSARLLAYAFVAAATLLLGLIARREFGSGVALTAAWVMTPLILLPGMDQFTANTEMFMLLPLLAAVACHARGRQTGHGLLPWTGMGRAYASN